MKEKIFEMVNDVVELGGTIAVTYSIIDGNGIWSDINPTGVEKNDDNLTIYEGNKTFGINIKDAIIIDNVVFCPNAASEIKLEFK